jgi:hypothetical protein
VEVKFIRPTYELVEAIASDMRQADIDEVWVASHNTPINALIKSWKYSDYSAIMTVNNEPCLMVGLLIHDMLSGVGIPWLLSCNTMLKYRSHFLKQAPGVINQMLSICPTLVNYAYAENVTSIQWLKKLGFKFDEPEPYGLEKKLFHRFHLEREV